MTQTSETALDRAAHPLHPTYGRIMDDRLYSTAEVAAILSVSASTLRRWRSEGHGPVVTRLFPSAPPRYKGSDLIEALEIARAGSAA